MLLTFFFHTEFFYFILPFLCFACVCLLLGWFCFAFYAVSVPANKLFLPDVHDESRHEKKSRSKGAQKVQQSEGIQHAADGSTESWSGLWKSVPGGVVAP